MQLTSTYFPPNCFSQCNNRAIVDLEMGGNATKWYVLALICCHWCWTGKSSLEEPKTMFSPQISFFKWHWYHVSMVPVYVQNCLFPVLDNTMQLDWAPKIHCGRMTSSSPKTFRSQYPEPINIWPHIAKGLAAAVILRHLHSNSYPITTPISSMKWQVA